MSLLPVLQSPEAYQAAYEQSVRDPEGFWAGIAGHFSWKKKWDKVLRWNFREPDICWFEGAQLNITENCLDRHLDTQGDQAALIWEPNDPAEPGITLSYRELHAQVCQAAHMLQRSGVQKGDRICIYMPMIPQLAIAVLACARIGAVHSVVFGGFSATALADRIADAACKLVITADGAYRGGKEIELKAIVDEALTLAGGVERVIVCQRTGAPVPMQAGRDSWWQEGMEGMPTDIAPVAMEAEDMLFILYTSGSTGKPKGVVHTCGGYMVYTAYTFANVFQYRPGEVYWCTADIGWITGHSYILYGPLLCGATTMMFEGTPTWPDAGRFWQVIDKYGVNIFYTAPTAIRSLMAQGLDFVSPYRLDSLRVIGSVGEPINLEAWEWYHHEIGKGRCPLVDTWWQTETGGILISSLAGVTPSVPTFATLPLPGVQALLLDQQGQEIELADEEGLLCIRFPWPGMIRTTYGDHERCRQTYFSAFPGYYFTGDAARRNALGQFRIIGRVDDVINVSGHRLGTAELENAINQDPAVIESAVVGYPHDIKGQGIYAFVICEHSIGDPQVLRQSIAATVNRVIGPIARPDKIQIVSGLPKTRSGKIMRRILRKVAEGDTSQLGDTSTLLDPGVVEEILQGRI